MHYVSSEFPNAQVGEVARVGWAYRCYVCRVASVCLYFLGSSSELEIHLAFVPQPYGHSGVVLSFLHIPKVV